MSQPMHLIHAARLQADAKTTRAIAARISLLIDRNVLLQRAERLEAEAAALKTLQRGPA